MPVKYNAEVTGENARNYFLTAALIRCRDGVGIIFLAPSSAVLNGSLPQFRSRRTHRLRATCLSHSSRPAPAFVWPCQRDAFAAAFDGNALRGPLCNGDKAFKLSLYDCKGREPGFSFAINFATPPGLSAYRVSLVLFIGSNDRAQLWPQFGKGRP